MQSLAYHFGVRQPDVDVTFTSLRMSYQTAPEEPTVIQVRQVKQRDIDYEDLTLVDHLVRDVLSDRVDLVEARTVLARIVSSGHHTPRWATTVGWGVMCAGVALLLGGNLTVIVIAFAAAVCIDRLQLLMARRRIPFFYQQVAGGGVATVLALGAVAHPARRRPVPRRHRQHRDAAGRDRLHGRPPGRAVRLLRHRAAPGSPRRCSRPPASSAASAAGSRSGSSSASASASSTPASRAGRA